MMTSNSSSNYSTSRRRGRKPTTRSEAWKRDHSQYESCSYDSLPLHPTENLQSRSPKTTKEFKLKSFRPKGSQLGDKDRETITTKQNKSNSINDSETNTALENTNRNNIIDYSSNTVDDPISDISIPDCSKNIQSGLYYNGRSSKADTPPILNDTLVSVQKSIIASETTNVPCIDRTKIKARTIKTINDTSTKTTKDMSITKNKEETILNKIESYIERKLNNQPISTKKKH
ncbi:hypothetical protein O181_099273 [Austropuccinia psidii MF-1]|uniref:Uncharacterized protein n=1 Tax=Austropuccinia psidii MF-1 TaxID=1389203 RepID=A0A9Q3JCD6_9BASI|nr:hypothetical protein [Austropuccinia psidii MF-1]